VAPSGALEAAREPADVGLRKIRQSVVREDNPQTRGLIKVVHHLVEVEEVK
jgi:large subunit ribosomal protein L30